MKQTIGAIVLVIIIILAVIFIATRGRSAGDARDEAAAVQREVIDTESLEIVTIATGEFENLSIDPATGYRRGSNGRLLAIPIECASCGERIPPHPMPEVAPGEPLREEMRRWEYKCPRCGGPGYEEGKGPSPDRM